MILRNEILLLLLDDNEIIYKTIKGDLYGMYSNKRGTIAKPEFLHIWEFDGETTVAIDERENYVEVN